MRIAVLDIARSIAIVMLLLAHIAQIMESPLGAFFGIRGFYYVSLGGVAVTIFLAISGLAIGLNYGSRETKYLVFIIKRILRIYPVYYMSLLVGIIVLLFDSQKTSELLSNFRIYDIFFYITGFHAYAGQWGGPFVTTSWFIGLIMTMYFCCPPISKAFQRSPHHTIIWIFFISVLSRLILGRYGFHLYRPLDWFPLCRIFEFGLGIYLARILGPTTLAFIKTDRYIYPVFHFISDLSLPLFLVHFPLLSILKFFSESGINDIFSITVYLFISLIVSWIILIIDKSVPREKIIRRINPS